MTSKKLCIIFIVSLLAFLTACSGGATSDKGKIVKLKMDELRQEYVTGYFYDNGDGTFSPLYNVGFDAQRDVACPLVKSDKLNEDALVPVVTSPDKVIYIQGELTDEAVDRTNKTLTLYPLKDKGYSVGMTFMLPDDGSLILPVGGNKGVKGSSAAGAIRGISSYGAQLKIEEINGSDKLPYGNISHVTGFLEGLEEGKKYTFGYYAGTDFKEMAVLADTHVLEYENVKMDLPSPYTKTKDGYFTVNLPVNLEEGYYIVDGYLFYYKSK